jgi:hypothetical protein
LINCFTLGGCKASSDSAVSVFVAARGDTTLKERKSEIPPTKFFRLPKPSHLSSSRHLSLRLPALSSSPRSPSDCRPWSSSTHRPPPRASSPSFDSLSSRKTDICTTDVFCPVVHFAFVFSSPFRLAKSSPKTAPSVLYRSAGRGARPASGGRPSVSEIVVASRRKKMSTSPAATPSLLSVVCHSASQSSPTRSALLCRAAPFSFSIESRK